MISLKSINENLTLVEMITSCPEGENAPMSNAEFQTLYQGLIDNVLTGLDNFMKKELVRENGYDPNTSTSSWISSSV
jgi:hypothetical protein